jgi:hypothetical protein
MRQAKVLIFSHFPDGRHSPWLLNNNKVSVAEARKIIATM